MYCRLLSAAAEFKTAERVCWFLSSQLSLSEGVCVPARVPWSCATHQTWGCASGWPLWSGRTSPALCSWPVRFLWCWAECLQRTWNLSQGPKYMYGLSYSSVGAARHLSRARGCPHTGRCVCRPAWCRCSDGPRRPGSSGPGTEPWPRLWVVQRTQPWHLWCSLPGCGSARWGLQEGGKKGLAVIRVHFLCFFGMNLWYIDIFYLLTSTVNLNKTFQYTLMICICIFFLK